MSATPDIVDKLRRIDCTHADAMKAAAEIERLREALRKDLADGERLMHRLESAERMASTGAELMYAIDQYRAGGMLAEGVKWPEKDFRAAITAHRTAYPKEGHNDK